MDKFGMTYKIRTNYDNSLHECNDTPQELKYRIRERAEKEGKKVEDYIIEKL